MILAGGVDNPPSQKSEIFDSPLYTRGPLGAAVIGTINYNLISQTQKRSRSDGRLLFSHFSFSRLEYPCPYWTQRETRLSVAEEMSAWDMTWL